MASWVSRGLCLRVSTALIITALLWDCACFWFSSFCLHLKIIFVFSCFFSPVGFPSGENSFPLHVFLSADAVSVSDSCQEWWTYQCSTRLVLFLQHLHTGIDSTWLTLCTCGWRSLQIWKVCGCNIITDRYCFFCAWISLCFTTSVWIYISLFWLSLSPFHIAEFKIL